VNIANGIGRSSVYKLLLILAISCATACTSVQIDEIRWEATDIDPSKETIVVMGRHHSPEFETEPSLVSCIGKKLSADIRGLNIIDAETFRDELYPWFEPRTAPLNLEKFTRVLQEPLIVEALEKRNIRYMIWIEGATEQVNSFGTMSCTAAPGFAGCFGFGSWEDESRYEASIWDYEKTLEVGRISTDANGTSYLPAVFVPIPILARVQANACTGMGRQISNFLQPSESG